MVEGKEIVEVREMTEEELEREGWSNTRTHAKTMALVLEDEQVIFPSMDPDGNGPGCLFGYDPDADQGFYVE
jgi:hypothetical protein